MPNNNQEKEKRYTPKINISEYDPTIAALNIESFAEEEKEDKFSSLSSLTKGLEELAELKELSEAERREKAAELDKEISKLKTEEDKMKANILRGRLPQLFSLELQRRRDVDREYSEIKKLGLKNSDELLLYFKDAFREKNVERCFAIMKNLADGGDFNELLHAYSYPSGVNGINDFFNEVIIGKMGVGEQVAYSFQNDISFTCEGIHQWDMAKTVVRDVNTGLYRQLNENEHAAAAMAQIEKLDARDVIRKFNRLAYGYEIEMPDGARVFKMSKLGWQILKIQGPAMAAKPAMISNEMCSNAVINLDKYREEMKKQGIHPKVIAAIAERAEKIRHAKMGNAVEAMVSRAETAEKYDMNLSEIKSKINELGEDFGEKEKLFKKLNDKGYHTVGNILAHKPDFIAAHLNIPLNLAFKLKKQMRFELQEAEDEEE